MRISSYIKKLPFFQLDEGVYPQLCPSVLVLFICLIYQFFNPPTILHSYCEGLIYFVRGGDILWRCANIYTQQCNIFICAGKKQKDKQRNTHKQRPDKPRRLVLHVLSRSRVQLRKKKKRKKKNEKKKMKENGKLKRRKAKRPDKPRRLGLHVLCRSCMQLRKKKRKNKKEKRKKKKEKRKKKKERREKREERKA